ncbi:hypothetical protein [Bradyrhizobium sp. BR 10289]|uniref:hypothetical protein n=1 Tax=Bradyrhizobium sp. BR 10289 TaxID=2749993 RepID=UPI001C652C34|nr:hypothetical protein [Bradyrhizobium sp. BR 10289]MBW7968050.1 hypothetical protein [Bradyrhizobium sp. BR 10289]
MAVLRQHVARMGLAAPKSTAWQITLAVAGFPLLLVIGTTLIAWLLGLSPDFLWAAGGIAAWVLIFLPTWTALFLNHRRVAHIFAANFLCVLLAGLCFLADMSAINWAGLDSAFWVAFLEWLVVLVWSLINSKPPAAAEPDHSAPPTRSGDLASA